jgi:beta-N-acetylhexosaminidase
MSAASYFRGAAVAAASVAASLGFGFGAPPAAAPDPYGVEELTIRQLAGSRVVCGFDGTRAPQSLLGAISAGEVGGVIYFDDNVRSRPQLAALSASIQAAPRPSALAAPVIVSVDQEGGQVERIAGAPSAGAEEMGRRGSAFAKREGAATAASLAGVGVNVDLAPVLDVARPGGFIDEQDRSFGRKPGRVAAAGVAFARGLQGAGVAATAKHFPGLGSTTDNTDLTPATIRLGAGALRRVDEAPYVAFAEAGGKLVMVSSARYPALGARKLPASQSKTLVRRELRRRLGYDGVTITDSLETPAAANRASPAEVAVRAAGAGMDLLLYVHCDAAVRAARALRKALASGALGRAAFEDSVERVLALREGLAP